MKIAVYPGTFDPITLGHLDIIRRGAHLVDKLVIGVTTNPSKEPMFSVAERLAMVKREIAGIPGKIEVVEFDSLLMDFAEAQGASMILRGLRAVADFEYEFQMAGMNQQLNDDIETVFLMADVSLQPIASKLVKEIARYGGKIDKFVTPAVAADVQRHLSRGSGNRGSGADAVLGRHMLTKFAFLRAVRGAVIAAAPHAGPGARARALPRRPKSPPTRPTAGRLSLSNGGTVVILLRPDLAPLNVARIQELTRSHFYDGLIFHRVIPGFMAQGGDPKGTGEGGSELPDLKAEFTAVPFLRGTVGAARDQSPDSANSQFFIMFVPDPASTIITRSSAG